MEKIDFEFKDWNEIISKKLGKGEWISVLKFDKAFSDVDRGCFFGVAVKNDLVDDVLKKYSWDLHSIDGGKPGFVSYFKNGEEIVDYYRHPKEGFEQLVYYRSFPGINDRYFELAEEFRLFHDLYEKDNQFFHFDDNGDKHLVAEIKEHEVKVKSIFLKKYISAKGMSLIIYFEFMRFSKKSIEDLGYSSTDLEIKDQDFIYSLCIRDLNGFGSENRKAQGWILGKKLINGIKDYKPTIWNEDKKFEEFIIGIDDDGNEVMNTCDENYLTNYFGKNPDSPHYLTPVYFKKEVLNKYYANSSDYEISDGIIRRIGFWSLRLDNNHSDFVNVFLGDLGKLSNKEQLYWKSFNIYSEVGISKSNWERSFLGKFSDPYEPDLFFKQSFQKFQRIWFEKFGWYLFKPLSEEDLHHFKSLRIPLTEDQKEFDEQVLSLTKIIIDSLNEKELKKRIDINLKDNAKGIDKFEAFLYSEDYSFPNMIQFLRNLQELRSTGSAHRKSSNYQKTKLKFNLNDGNYKSVFAEIFIQAIMIFNTLGTYFLDENYTQQSI